MPQLTDTLGMVRESAGILDLAGCDTPRLDAELLVAHALGCDRTALVRDAGEPLDPVLAQRCRELIERRRLREPVAQITGIRHFRRLELFVDRRVLTPRPETELLVEWGLRLPRGATVIDVGTGSGAIALALADERPDLDITATDIDRDALAVAAINAARLGLDVSFLHGDLLEQAGGRIDAVISNPPYLADDEMAGLEPEVVDHEPRIALCAGADGLGAVRRLVAEAAARNVPAIALEIGIGQADEALALIAASGWTQTEVIDDLAGIARVVAGTRAER